MERVPLELHPAAVDEARAARQWYAVRSSAAADAFMAALDEVVLRISERPERSSSYLYDTRQYVLRHFPFVVVYRTSERMTQIVAIAHARRRPGYWKNRDNS